MGRQWRGSSEADRSHLPLIHHTVMNKLLNGLISRRTLAALILTGATVACIGCQSIRSKVNGPVVTDASVRQPEPKVPDRSQTSAHNPLQYHIEVSMWPLATNSAQVHPEPYDRTLLEAITQRWYSLLDNVPTISGKGKLVMEFKLRSNGTIVESWIVNSTVGPPLETTCQHAVLDTAPFAPWPETMRRAFTDGYRIMTLIFYVDGNG
jgi:hypothetical protein